MSLRKFIDRQGPINLIIAFFLIGMLILLSLSFFGFIPGIQAGEFSMFGETLSYGGG